MYVLIIEVILVLFFAHDFYSKERPKLKFLMLGIIFSLLSIILQLPLRIAELELKDLLTSNTLPLLLIAFGIPILTESIKYFSLKRYMKTRSQKNGIFFGIGWVGIESISYISLTLYTIVFSYLSLTYQPQSLVSASIPLWSFIFFFIINLSITVFVILAVTKKKFYYVFYAILYSAIVYLVLLEVESKLLFQGIFLLCSLFIIFRYRLFR